MVLLIRTQMLIQLESSAIVRTPLDRIQLVLRVLIAEIILLTIIISQDRMNKRLSLISIRTIILTIKKSHLKIPFIQTQATIILFFKVVLLAKIAFLFQRTPATIMVLMNKGLLVRLT